MDETLPGAKEAKQMQRDYVGGKVDRIADRKTEIRYEDILDFKATVDKSKKLSYDSKNADRWSTRGWKNHFV